MRPAATTQQAGNGRLIDPFVLAWRQLSHGRVKLAAATAGVVVAVLLMLMQLGFRQAAYDTALFVPQQIRSDLVVVSSRTRTMFQSTTFPNRLNHRLRGIAEVTQVQGVYLGAARWRNPWTFQETPIFCYGFEPGEMLLGINGLAEAAEGPWRQPDAVVYDELSRPYFGPIPQHFRQGERVEAELNRRSVQVVGLVKAGITFTSDGNMFMSDTNFLRVFRDRPSQSVDIGLIRIAPGADRQAVRAQAQQMLGAEVKVYTQPEFVNAEVTFLKSNSPIEFIFSLGAAVGFFIGFVIVYQILFSDISNHLPQYATMKAMGFSDGYLLRIVQSSAFILALLGYLPGFVMSLGVYQLAAWATFLPMSMTWFRGVGVFLLTLTMCMLSAALAVRKLQSADPADVF